MKAIYIERDSQRRLEREREERRWMLYVLVFFLGLAAGYVWSVLQEVCR